MMKFYKKSDILVIAIILAVSALTWIIYDYTQAEKTIKAEIYYYAELVEIVDLDDAIDRVIPIPQDPNVIIHLKDGQIFFEESDCPDKVCIKTGRLHKIGQYAACLPNGVILKIVPGGERSDDDIDIIIGQ